MYHATYRRFGFSAERRRKRCARNRWRLALPLCVALASTVAMIFALAVRADVFEQRSLIKLAQGRFEDEWRHLWRLAVWGGTSLIAGAALLLLKRGQFLRGFAAQTAAWGTIDLLIAVVGLSSAKQLPPPLWTEVFRAERNWHDILLLNTGLNVAYIAVGLALFAAGKNGVRHAAAWRGHGAGVAVQGAALFLLDGIVLLASRGRLAELLRLIS